MTEIDETPVYGKTCLSMAYEGYPDGWYSESYNDVGEARAKISFADENLLSPSYCDKYGFNVESTQAGWWRSMLKITDSYPAGNILAYPFHLLTNEEFCIGQPDRNGDGVLDDITHIYREISEADGVSKMQVSSLSQTSPKPRKAPL